VNESEYHGSSAIGRAVVLIAITAALGYSVGRIIGAIWNSVHSARARHQ
jgi:hypothetical protein